MLVAFAGLLLAQALPAEAGEWKVKVDGATYRVNREGDEIEVAKKAIYVFPSPQLHANLHEAVRIATGCELVDEMWSGLKLVGRLDCSGAPRRHNEREAPIRTGF